MAWEDERDRIVSEFKAQNLPEVHGDLISRDDAIRAFKAKWCPICNLPTAFKGKFCIGLDSDCMEVGWLKEIPAAQPTAQERPVWHDLRKNPDDLPPYDEEMYIVELMGFEGENCTGTGHYINETTHVLAWCEFPRWDGASE